MVSEWEEKSRVLNPFFNPASGGMRTVEALAIRIKDIDFTVNPTKIHIREEYAKTRVARDIYLSDEATQYLKAWLEWKYRPDAFNPKTQNKNDLVFEVGQSGDPRALYVDISHEFGKLLDLSGFSEKKDNSPRRKITLHTFRRFVDSTITTQAGQDYAEWFLGHADNSYYNKKEHELRAIYKKDCMKYLTFLDYTTIEATGNSIEAKLTEKEKEIQLLRQRDQVKDQEMQSMKEQIQTIMTNLGMINQTGKNKLARQLFKKGMYELDTDPRILHKSGITIP